MKMKTDSVKSSQEQAVASWVQYLNKIRLENLIKNMNRQDINLDNALKNLDDALSKIEKLISSRRGGEKGIHGYIAEISEVGIGNAKANIIGNENIYKWVNDNGEIDLIRNGTNIQQKFYKDDLSLGGIARYSKKHPDFTKQGGKFQIPKDQYAKIKYLLSLPESKANKMPTSDGTFSLKQWKKVNKFFKEGSIEFDSVEPSNLEYSEVQKNVITKTIDIEKNNIKKQNKEIKKEIIDKHKPTIGEGIKVTAVSSVIEGGTTFVSLIVKKKKERKLLKNFTSEDWNEIIKDSGISTIKGGIRGGSLYGLTNYTNTPSAVANALVTSSFGIAEQVHLYKNGKITENEFLENSELLTLDASISAISSMLGQTIIPIPIIGAIIGNTIGLKMYDVAKNNFAKEEQILIQKYCKEIESLEDNLMNEYQEFTKKVKQEICLFMKILDKLYSPNIQEIFDASIEMAKYYDVPGDEILDTKEKIDNYFLE